MFPAQIIANNEAEWQRLRFVLEGIQPPILLWITYDSPISRAEYRKRIGELLPNHVHHDLHLDTSVVALPEVISQTLRPSKQGKKQKTVIHIGGLETLLNKPSFLANLNFQREVIFSRFHVILILWTSAEVATAFQQKAQDFWQWVNFFFQFADSHPAAPQTAVSIPRLLTKFPTDEIIVLGREEKLLHIRQKLFKERKLAIVGPGGIGKTTLAHAYCIRLWEQYNHIAWITVANSLTDAVVHNSLLASSLGMLGNVTELIATGRDDAALNLILRTIANLNGPVLIVFDDMDDMTGFDVIQSLFVQFPGHILITSRLEIANWPLEFVDALLPSEAARLFRLHYSYESVPKKELLPFIETLKNHTLTIELVAKFGTVFKVPFQEIKARFSNLDTNRGTEAFLQDFFANVITDFSPIEKDALQALTLLPPSIGHNLDIIETIFNLLYIPTDANILRKFVNTGLLNYEESDSANPVWSMPPLISEISRKALPLYASSAASVISDVAERINYDPFNPKHKLIEKTKDKPYAEYLVDLFYTSATKEMAYLLDRLANLEYTFGHYQRAKELLEVAVAAASKNYRPGYPALTNYESNLANVYLALGDYEKSRELFENILTSSLKNFGPDHPNVAVSQYNLAEVYSNLGQFDKARDLLESALSSDLKNFGPGHPLVAIRQSGLGEVYRNLGQIERAKALLESALSSDLKNFGPDHPVVTTVQSNLANVYTNLGEYEKARELLELALNSNLKTFGPEHPSVALRQSNLAAVYRHLGQYEKAKDLLELALASDLKNFGPEHPNVALRQSNLGVVYRNLGQNEKALELLEASLSSSEKLYGPDHPMLSVIQTNLAIVYLDLGQYKKAQKLLESALNAGLKILPPDHPDIATRHNNLAHVYLAEGNYSQAYTHFQQALDIVSRAFGQEHPYFKTTVNSINDTIRRGAAAGDVQMAGLLEQIPPANPEPTPPLSSNP